MAKKRKKGAIPKQEAPETEEEKVVVLENEFTIDLFYKKWVGGTNSFYKRENFTNCLVNPEQFEDNMMIIMMEYFPKIYKDYDDIFNAGQHYGHCHPVANEKLSFVIEAIKEVHGDDVSKVEFDKLNSDGYAWWYIGFKQNIRIVGLFNSNNQKFLPMLIDHHHLIHDSEYFNDNDYGKYSHCPVKNFEKKHID